MPMADKEGSLQGIGMNPKKRRKYGVRSTKNEKNGGRCNGLCSKWQYKGGQVRDEGKLPVERHEVRSTHYLTWYYSSKQILPLSVLSPFTSVSLPSAAVCKTHTMASSRDVAE